MKQKIPILLIYSRLVIGLIFLFLPFVSAPYYAFLGVTFLIIGLLTDIFDGIIARKLGISSERLRRLDSTIDQVFHLCIVISTIIKYPIFYTQNWKILTILGISELLIYVISFVKFKKEVATHSLGAKLWSLIIFATLVEIISTGNSNILLKICVIIGIITRIEIMAILFILPKWTNDVPSVFHAIKIKKNIPIKRNKLFNG